MKTKISIVTLLLVGIFTSLPLARVSAQFGAPAKPVATPTTGASASADLNADGKVEFTDLNILLGAWGKCSAAKCMPDLDGNRAVNEEDLDLMRAAWTGGPSSEITSMVTRCRTITDPASRFSCFLRLAQELEIDFKGRMVFEGIRNNTIVVPNKSVESRMVERAFKHMMIYVNNLIKRGYVILNRLDQIADRIETRMNASTGQASNSDAAEAKRLLSEGRAKLAEARTDLGMIAGTYEKTLQTNPQALFEDIRGMISTIKEGRRILLEALSHLK